MKVQLGPSKQRLGGYAESPSKRLTLLPSAVGARSAMTGTDIQSFDLS